ncbi:MAG: enolase C-terminal domain-like protein [Candidatus Paceibacterota bacterium]|jgi:enolase
MRIDTISARTILDTRGRPTIETTLSSESLSATASVPSGKSTGSHEALELRDTDGGVATAIEHVTNEIARTITGRDFASPDEVDELLITLDGTPNKSRLGANAILSVSIATERLFAAAAGQPLWKAIAHRAGTTPRAPRLFMNVMNGGVHADFKLPFQEYILVVEGTTSEALPIAREAFTKLGERLGNVPMGDEGGYAPTFDTLERPFELLAAIVAEFPGTSIAIDAAASEFFKDGAYHLLGASYTAEELLRIYENLVEHFPLKSIEDPFDEDAASDFARLTSALSEKALIVGDDFTVTNPARIESAIAQKAINAVLIKPNQIGTVREVIRAVQMTHAAGLETIASHRSGETDDTFIADFAYGTGAYGIKAGGLGQKERLEKYERLLAIEQESKTV